MFTRAIIVFFTLLLLASPIAAREGPVDIGCIAANRLHRFPPTERTPGDQCDACNNNYYWTVDGWLVGNESYKTYCDPFECPECVGGWKPMSVTIYLYWDQENACELTLSVDVEQVDLSVPDCPMPGSLIAASDPITVGPLSPAGLWAITIPLPEDCPVLDEPFFASINFLDTCTDMPALVTDEGPCLPCLTWNDWGSGWQDLCDFSFPGNLSVYTTLECQGPSPVQRTTWTTIKNSFRSVE